MGGTTWLTEFTYGKLGGTPDMSYQSADLWKTIQAEPPQLGGAVIKRIYIFVHGQPFIQAKHGIII